MKVLIVGQGIAGSHLAREFDRRKIDFKVVDRPAPTAASCMAAGLVNPIAGRRHRMSWGLLRFIPRARQAWQEAEEDLGIKLVHPMDFSFFFRDAADRDDYLARDEDQNYRRFAGPAEGALGFEDRLVRPFGSFSIHECFRVDLARFISRYREELLSRGRLIESEFSTSELMPGDSTALRWRGEEFDLVVYCQGFELSKNQDLSWLDFRLSRGDILEVSFEDETPDRGLNFGKWLLPTGPRRGRLGSTYHWGGYDEGPSDKGRRELEEALSRHWRGEFRTTAHLSGARAGTNDSRPYVGRMPEDPRRAIFGGFGSKGTLTVPGLARDFVDHILDDVPLMEEADVRRRLKFRDRPR